MTVRCHADRRAMDGVYPGCGGWVGTREVLYRGTTQPARLRLIAQLLRLIGSYGRLTEESRLISDNWILDTGYWILVLDLTLELTLDLALDLALRLVLRPTSKNLISQIYRF